MELLMSGVALQAIALALLALVLLSGDAGKGILVKLRADGRTEHGTDEPADERRRQVVRSLIGLFLGGTMIALLGLPRL